MKRFWSILLSLLMVLTLLPAFHVHEAHAEDVWERVTSLTELSAGAEVVLAARYNATATNYHVMTANTTGKPAAIAFVADTSTGVHSLPASVTDSINTYKWTLGGATGAWTLTNASNSVLGYASGTNFTASTNGTWTITETTSGASAKVASYVGWKIGNAVTTARAIACNTTPAFGPYSYSSNNNNATYLFSIDIFMKKSTVVGGVSYSALNAAITSAQNLVGATVSSEDGAGVEFGSYWATAANISTMNAAITTAQALLDSTVQDDVDAGVTALQSAITTFEGQRTLSNDTSAIQDIAVLKTQTTGTTQTVKGWLVYRYGGSAAETMSCAVLEDYSDTNGAVNGVVIYNDALSAFNIGDYVYVTGTYSPYNGMPEITNVTASGLGSAPVGETAPAAQQYASWAAAVADLANINGEYISITNVTLGTYDATTTTHTDSLSGSITAYRGVAYDGANSENTAALAGSLVNLHGMFEYNNTTLVSRLRVGTPKNYEASGVAVQYAVNISAVTNGTILVENAAGDEVLNGDLVDHGTVLTITATPDTTYILDTLTVNGSPFTSGQNHTVIGETTIAATFKQPDSYTVSYTVPSDCSAITADTVVEGGSIATLPTPSVTAIGDYTFAGWMAFDASFTDDQTSAPTYVTAPYTPTASVTLVAVYTKTVGSGGTASLTKMIAGATLAVGDKIVIVANGTTFGMYQQTVSSSYVETFNFVNDSAAIAADSKMYWDVTAGSSAFHLGDATNGYLESSTSSNNLYCGNQGAEWSLVDNGDGTFKLDNSSRYLSYRSDLSATKWRMAGSNHGTSGTANLDLYKYVAGGGSSTYYTANPSGAVTEYTVTYETPENGTLTVEDENGDAVISGSSVSSGTVLTITATPTDAVNYELATLTVNEEDFTSGETFTVTTDTTIAATFSAIIRYTANFVDKGAAYGTPQTVVSGEAVTLATGLTGLGDYTFVGWMVQDASFQNDTTEAPTLYNNSYVPTSNVTLVAIYSKTAGSLTYYTMEPTETVTYSVTFEDGFGTTLDNQLVAEGDGATAPEDPSHEGYTFAGWDVAYDCIEATTVVTATWTVNTYALTISCGENGSLTVSYYVEGALTYAASGDMIPFGTVLTINATPATNCKLTSLTVAGEAQASGTTFDMPAAAVTVAATFAAKEQYTITFLKLGTNYDEYTVYEGETLTFEALGTTVGDYTFAGWIIDTADAYAVDNASAPVVYTEETTDYVPTADTTFKAVYTKAGGAGGTGYTMVNGASEVTPGTYLIGALRSAAATDDFYFATTTISSGDINTNAAATTIAADAVTGARTIATLPDGAVEFTFAGNSDNGYTITADGENYLGWTEYSSRKLAWGAYSGTTWVPVADNDASLVAGGLHLAGNNGTNSPYTLSENSTAVGAIRGYASSTQYRAIYLFKSAAGGSTYYNTNPASCAHENTEIRDAVAANCVDPGYTGDTWCTDCNTMIAAGSATDIDPENHKTVVEDVAVAATCTATGLTAGSHCSACTTTIVAQTEVAALGHDMITDEAVAATCLNTGLTEGSHCSRCNDATTAQVEVAALGHDMVTDAAVAANCHATGLTAGEHCSRCDDATIAQTVTQIDPTNHDGDTEIRNALAATNIATGYTGDTYCLGCNTKIADGEVIPMLTDAPVTGIRTLGAQVKIDTWDAIRFGASFNVESLKAALEPGDTFNYGFRATLKSKMNESDLLGTNSFVGATYYAKAGGIEWLAEYEDMTAEELANALSAAGAKVFTYDATTITFVLVIKNVPSGSAENIVFRPFTEVKGSLTFGFQMYNSIKAIMDGYGLGNDGAASVMFPDEQ